MAYRDESPSESRGRGYESYFRPHVEIALSKLQTRLEASRGAPTLNLADSFIGDDGCEIVAKFIRESPNLTTLELFNLTVCVPVRGGDYGDSRAHPNQVRRRDGCMRACAGDAMGACAHALVCRHVSINL